MRLVLLGGGHAHLFVLEALRAGRLPGADVTLVSSSPRRAYAAVLPSLVSGQVAEADCAIDLPTLARQAGARFVEERIDRIDPAGRELRLAGGRLVDYDYLSLAVGAEPAGLDVPGVQEHAHLARSIEGARALGEALDAAGDGVRVLVVGGGPQGIALAFAARTRLGTRGHVALLEASERLLAGRLPAASDLALRALRARNVGVAMGARVQAVERDAVTLGFGARVPADLVVWAGGVTATPLAQASGLETDERGFLIVDGNLRSVSHPHVFAAGDAAVLLEAPGAPRPGPYAARQGAVLARNLAALAAGKPVTRFYRPQQDQLLLIGTGAGRALFVRGRTALVAPWAMRLKDFLDRGFSRRFRDLRRG